LLKFVGVRRAALLQSASPEGKRIPKASHKRVAEIPLGVLLALAITQAGRDTAYMLILCSTLLRHGA
jgi:hypothetical protein